MAHSDVALFERWAATHDADVFAEIVSRYSAMVYSTCKRALGNAADAEDVAQECFIELAQTDVQVRLSLGGWLHTVATRRSLDRIKSEARRKTREKRYARELSGYAETTWDDVQGHIDQAIADLPEKFREPIVARFLLGGTHEAIAGELGISRSTVQYRLARGLSEIRKGLKRRGVLVALSALAAMLNAHIAEATPVALTASLGKLAIAASMHVPAAQVATGAAAKAAATAGLLLTAKKAAVALGAAVVVAAGVMYASGNLPLTHAPEPADQLSTETYRFSFGPSAERGSKAGRAGERSAHASAISGQVVDPAGMAVPGARVLVIQLMPMDFFGDVCGARGGFRFEGLRPGGRCIVVADHDAYSPSTRRGFDIPADDDLVGVRVHLNPR